LNLWCLLFCIDRVALLGFLFRLGLDRFGSDSWLRPGCIWLGLRSLSGSFFAGRLMDPSSSFVDNVCNSEPWSTSTTNARVEVDLIRRVVATLESCDVITSRCFSTIYMRVGQRQQFWNSILVVDFKV
jgi:hypothetical protein